jgi:hypothetical protein
MYLILDLYVEVPSLTALFSNFIFWVYWITYCIGAEIALFTLHSVGNAAIKDLPEPLVVLAAIAGTTTVLQSLTFKIGGRRILDLSQHLDDYRREVASSSAKLIKRQENRRVMRQSRQILQKVGYKEGDAVSETRLRREYADVMLFGQRAAQTVKDEIDQIAQDCSRTGASFGEAVAERIARTDPEWVRNFLAFRSR